MITVKPKSVTDTDLVFDSDNINEQRWLAENEYSVLDEYTRQAFCSQAQYLGYHDFDMSKMTFDKYLKYGKDSDGYLQFAADLTGESYNPDDLLDKQAAYLIWMNLSREMGFTMENLKSLATLANSMYKQDADESKWCSGTIDRGRRIAPKCSLSIK